MTETTRTESATEERTCRLCERPAGRVHFIDEDAGLCPAHNRVARARDEVDDWESAYHELTKRIAPVLDPHCTTYLERLVEPVLEEAKAGLARAYGELELAKAVAEYRRDTPIEQEEVRLLIRSDHLRRAYDLVDHLPANVVSTETRWGMVGALLEASEEASKAFDEFKRVHDIK